MDLPDASERARRRPILDVLSLVPAVMPPTKESGSYLEQFLETAPRSELVAEIRRRTAERDALREVAHQIVGFSRTVQGEHPTVQAVAENARAALERPE